MFSKPILKKSLFKSFSIKKRNYLPNLSKMSVFNATKDTISVEVDPLFGTDLLPHTGYTSESFVQH